MMKYITLFLIITVTVWAAPPQWFLLQNLSKQKHEIIGYGEGATLQEAKNSALADISAHINVHIDSSFKSSASVVDGDASKALQKDIKQTTQSTITEYLIVKSDAVDGHYYTALLYDNRPFVYKFKSKLPKLLPTDEKQNPYLQKSALIQELNRSLGVKLDYKLLRKNGGWYLAYKDVIQLLDAKNFEKLFVTYQNPKINFTTSTGRTTLYDGEIYFFNMKAQETGYLTLIGVFEDGTVYTIQENVPVKKAQALRLPDAKGNEDFEAYVPEGIKGDVYDLYVALWTKEPRTYSSYGTISSDALDTDERYKKFDLLIESLHGDFSVFKMITKHRSTRNGL